MKFFVRMLTGFALGCGLLLLNVVGAKAVVGNPPPPEAWRLSPVDGLDARPLCVPDRVTLLRTGMPGARCARQLIAGGRGEQIVLATCKGAGWSRSAFRSTGAGAMRVETQGIRHGQPFATSYEARSVATCAATSF